MRNHDRVVAEQYNPVADAYLESKVHSQGEDLEDLAAFAKAHPDARILDLGCGAGHVSYAVSPFAASVTAYDLSENMLSVVQRAAVDRDITNIQVKCGHAEKLPFNTNTFDLIISRYSAHHWASIETVAAEMRRVLKTGGKLVVIDVISPQNALLTTYLQSVELLRDTSHVRNRSLVEWKTMLEQEGLKTKEPRQWKLPLDFATWVERMQTPAERVAAIKSLWTAAPSEVLEYFDVQADGSFAIDVAWIEAVKRD